MGMLNPYRAYMETEVSTASQGRLVLMLYNGAIRFINEAKSAISQKRVEDAHNKVTRATDIVTELRLSLDREAGGEIAHNLDELYGFVTDQLAWGNIRKRHDELDAAIAVLTDLRDAWATIVASGAGTQR